MDMFNGNEELMWKAIRGALGREKEAYLRKAPLNKVAANVAKSRYGVNVSDDFSIGDAVGTLAVSWRQKKAEHRRIRKGLTSLKSMQQDGSVKTASSKSNDYDVYPADASTFHKIAAASKLRKLKKLATTKEQPVLDDLMREVDQDVLDSLKKEAEYVEKQASARRSMADAATGAFNRGKQIFNDRKGQLATGALVGTGATVPAVVGGKHLINEAEESAQRTTEDARNKALQTAAGTTALAVGGNQINNLLNQGTKQASVNGVNKDLMSAIYVNELLEYYPSNEKTAKLKEDSARDAVNILCKLI